MRADKTFDICPLFILGHEDKQSQIMVKMTRTKRCRYCGKEKPVGTLLLTHEVQCLRGPKVKRCPKCQERMSNATIRATHLAYCLPLMNNTEANASNVTEVSINTHCPFCQKDRKRVSLYQHFLICNEFRMAETVKKCMFCPKEGPVTVITLHESKCSMNKVRTRSFSYCSLCRDYIYTPKSNYSLRKHLVEKCLRRHFETTMATLTNTSASSSRAKRTPVNDDTSQSNRTTRSGNRFDHLSDDAVSSNDIDMPHLRISNNVTSSTPDFSEITNIMSGTTNTTDEIGPELPSASTSTLATTAEVFKCPFCHEDFDCLATLTKVHPIRCRALKTLENYSECQHCGKGLFPESWRLLHEIKCQSLIVLDQTTVNIIPKIKCPHCSIKYKAIDLPRHLSKCMKLHEIIEQALRVQESLKQGPYSNAMDQLWSMWKVQTPVTEDLLLEAGIQFWIEPQPQQSQPSFMAQNDFDEMRPFSPRPID